MSEIKILDACCGSKMFWFDKNEPHTTFIPVMNGKSSVLVPTRTKRKYILVVSGYAGNKQVEETFEVTAEEYKYYEIGNTFIQDAVLENKEGDKQ